MTTTTAIPTTTTGIRCGHCRQTHPTSADVRACWQATQAAAVLDARIRSARPEPRREARYGDDVLAAFGI